MECKNKTQNLDFCNCTYSSCPRKGLCCECLQYHLPAGQLPACFFSPEGEKTYDRSLENYLADKKRNGK